MKLDTPSIPVITGGVVDKGEFKIKNSAIAFKILSSGLYSNKFKAILRELGCNAYDSHVEAGCPEKPFTVHLPTRLNPILSIRDYGTGLTHDQIMNLYTTYFESTKSDSNDFVGCMGLGSKSPFSYTKNFTISAIQDGVKGVYSAYIGEQGVPSIIQLSSDVTDEPNGLEVSFPVEDRHDMSQFRHEVADTYKWFMTKPEVTGDSVDIPEIEFAQENIIDGVHLQEGGGGYYSKSFAIMGNVAYPIKVPDGEDLPDGVRSLYNNNGFICRFEIGELDIAASREELGYDPHTIKSLSDKAEEIMLALEGYVEDKLTPAKTKWDRNLAAAALVETNQELFGEIVNRYITKHPKKFVKGTNPGRYNSVKFSIPLAELDKIDGLRVAYKAIRHGGFRSNSNVTLAIIKPDSETKPKRLQKKNASYGENNWAVHNINPKDTTIIFNDEGGNILQRIRLAVKDDDYKDLLKPRVLVCAPQNKKFDKAKMLKFIKTRTGNAPIVLASQLPEMVKGSSGPSGNLQITVQQFYHRNISYHNNHWSFTTIYSKLKDIEPTLKVGRKKIYLYVPLSHKSVIKPYQAKGESSTWTADMVHERIENNDIHEMAGFDLDKVYGLNKTSIKAISKSKQWVPLFDFISEKFEDIDWKSARKDVENALIRREFSNESFDPAKAPMDKFEKIAKTKTAAGKLFAAYLASKEDITAAKKKRRTPGAQFDRVIIGMTAFFPEKDFSKSSAKLDVKGIEGKYEKLFENFRKKYPMLTHLDLDSGWNSTTDWDDAVGYIKLVDSVK